MKLKFLEQHVHFFFNVNEVYYRIEFDLDQQRTRWSMRLIDLGNNETVYRSTMDTIITPDIQLAEDIMKTYILRDVNTNIAH